MGSTRFEYTVSSRPNAVYPLTAVLTCAEVIKRTIRLETTSLSLPDQTIDHNTGFIPLYTRNDVVCITHFPYGTTFLSSTITFSLNCTGISHIMNRFGVANDGSTISREIDEAICSISSEGKGVVEVKIWKITTKLYNIDKASENLLIERYGSVLEDDPPVIHLIRCNSNGSVGCAICLEDYKEGSIVVKLPCGHDFHGVCINQWSQIKHLCPICRFKISSRSSSFSFFIWSFKL